MGRGSDCESEVGMVIKSNMRESGGDGNVLSLDCIDANILVAINAISVLQDFIIGKTRESA